MSLNRRSGFTLIEVMLAVFFTVILITLFSGITQNLLKKTFLQTEFDRVSRTLIKAREQSIAVYQGQAYAVTFDITPDINTFTMTGSQPQKLSRGVRFKNIVGDSHVLFSPLTGFPTTPTTITLALGDLEADINISSAGFISTSPITKP